MSKTLELKTNAIDRLLRTLVLITEFPAKCNY